MTLRRRDSASYALELRFSHPESDADIRLMRDGSAPVQFDATKLLAAALDAEAYGRSLAESLFNDSAARSAFSQARTSAQSLGAPLRLRLLIGADAAERHSLRWETLRDPDDGAPFLMGEQLVFSRYLSSSDWRPVKMRPKGDLRALVESAADLIQQSAGFTEALTLVARVVELNAVAEIPPPSWDRLCWEGSLAGHAGDLREVCGYAVAAAPDDGLFHDSRGLARALTGDLSGAAADFKAFVAWAPTHSIEEARVAKRWERIAALEGGRSPFDDAMLQALCDEVNEHQRPDAAQQ